MNWLWFIIGFVSPIVLFFVFLIVYALIMTKKYGNLQKCCVDCKKLFPEDDYNYCPHCGKKLEHHPDYLNYIRKQP